METKQSTIIRILAIALLVALLAIVALSFALCSSTTASQVGNTAPVAVNASTSDAAGSTTGGSSAQPSGAQNTASGAWDEETDDEPTANTQETSGSAGNAGTNASGSGSSDSAGTNASGNGSLGSTAQVSIDENGTYTSKDEVALYIHTYGHLPSNYISKSKAKKAGWVSSKGNLDEVLPGMSIGGSEFYNNEGQLPDAAGRTWTECDINYAGGYRGAERIVFSNDGLIFYTDDHYETFEQLY